MAENHTFQVFFTQRDLEIAAKAFTCLKDVEDFPSIDNQKLAQAAGFKTSESARVGFVAIKKKLIAASKGAEIVISDRASPVKPKATPTPRKRKGATAEGDDDAADADATPTSKPKRSKKAAPKTKAQAEAEAEADDEEMKDVDGELKEESNGDAKVIKGKADGGDDEAEVKD